MLKIADKELHLKRPRDLSTSSHMVAFFIGGALRRHKFSLIAFVVLAGLAVVGQVGFLWILQNLLGRLPDANTSHPAPTALSDLTSSIPTSMLIGLSLLSLL